MAHEEMLEALARRRAKALAMGGEARLARRAAQGVLDARARLDCLLDAGSFNETGLFATSFRAEDRERTPADGKVTGFGRIDGRPGAVVSHDFTVLGASSSQVNGKKIRHVKDIATSRGLPIVFLGESAGARIPDRMGSAGRAILGQDPTEYQRLRVSPWVSAQLGSCFGSSTWYGCMSDYVVMRKGAVMAVASHRVTSTAIGQAIEPEELGGWRLLTGVSGLVDLAVDTDEQAIAAVRRFLSYLPGHCNEAPPALDPAQVAAHDPQRLLDLLPAARSQVYDMRRVLEAIADVGSLFELKGRFGRSIVTALARIEGRSVGFIANNPLFKGGAIDALSMVTVPKVSVILRKSYGQAYLNMGGGRNSDVVAAWPSADLGFMDPRVGASVLTPEGGGSSTPADLSEQIARDRTAWGLAALYEAHAVIDPRDTRAWLAATLEALRSRLTGGVGQHRLANWPTSF